MTDGQEKTIGEIGRAVERIEAQLEALTAKVNEVVVPVSTLGIRMTSAETNLLRLDGDVKSVTKFSATISGGIAVLSFFANWLKGHW